MSASETQHDRIERLVELLIDKGALHPSVRFKVIELIEALCKISEAQGFYLGGESCRTTLLASFPLPPNGLLH